MLGPEQVQHVALPNLEMGLMHIIASFLYTYKNLGMGLMYSLIPVHTQESRNGTVINRTPHMSSYL